jgi:hypothetical protein
MTACPDCIKSATELWHGFRANCEGCAARGVGRGPNFRRVRDAGRLDRKYRSELDLVGVTHDQVKAAHAADFAERATP